MKKDKIFKVAEKLRKEGCSIKEIGRRFKISQSTASVWLRDVKVSKIGEDRLEKKQQIGRRKGVETNIKKRKESLRRIFADCSVLRKKEKFAPDNLKIFLALLHWCEGSKTGSRVIFTNSDPEMIKVFLFLLRKSFLLNEDKFRAVLHLHGYHDRPKMLKYWSDVTGIEKKHIIIYNKKNSGKRKKIGYNGCISVSYGDVRILEEIFLIIRRFVTHIN